MRRYVHRCGVCRGTSRPVMTRWKARQLAARHRARIHPDLRPDGEKILEVGWSRDERRFAAVILFFVALGLLYRAASWLIG